MEMIAVCPCCLRGELVDGDCTACAAVTWLTWLWWPPPGWHDRGDWGVCHADIATTAEEAIDNVLQNYDPDWFLGQDEVIMLVRRAAHHGPPEAMRVRISWAPSFQISRR